ncbi:MAG TPA: oxidoreductase [Planctomycetaceae bacterium]|nr:oxidoreductase [Planctomycetaceae bacterium]
MKFWQVDAFTATPFAGNPAAVCILDVPASEDWMQNVAMEMNLAETAFAVQEDEKWHIRWFTPNTEVDLCGHATLATVHVLKQTGKLEDGASITFQSRSGPLVCSTVGDRIELNFPATRPGPLDAVEPADVLSALKLNLQTEQVQFLQSCFDVLVVVTESELVRSASPDISAVAALPVRGVILTAKNDKNLAQDEQASADFVSRFFAPACDVPEDPVTGSAHCCLAPYWAEQLGKNDLVGYQASRRGGFVSCRVEGDRVILSGNAVTVAAGELLA